uniref:TEP1-F n=1 Tax=Aceria tosichella TaxID=561515 RepID=A0A6G1SQR0_9ACAR
MNIKPANRHYGPTLGQNKHALALVVLIATILACLINSPPPLALCQTQSSVTTTSSVTTSSSPPSAGPNQDGDGGSELLLDKNENPPPKAAAEEKQQRPEQVTIIAPKFLRPNSDYHVLVNLAANHSVPATIDLQLIGARDSDREQTEAKSVLVHPNETQTVRFQVADWPAAEYVLSANVEAIDKSWSFKEEKPLVYQAKSFSVFIQTDKAIYKPGQLVQFRALFLTPTLTPFALKNQEINVTIEDPGQNIIKQWQYLSNYRGLLSLDMPLSDDPMLGDYTIKLAAKGQEFKKSFTVAEYVLPTFDVSIQLPSYATYNESDIVATVRASYTYGKPVNGHVTLTVQPLVRFSYIDTRPLEQAQYKARLSKKDGSADFQVDLVKDLLKRESSSDIFEREIEFFALVEEDLTGRKYNKTQRMKIYPDKIKIERLDKSTGSLKPGLPRLIRYKVAYQDDIPVENSGPEVELKYNVLGRPIKELKLRPINGLIEHQLVVPAQLNDSQLDTFFRSPNRVNIVAIYRNQHHYLDSLAVHQTDSHQYMQIYLPQLQRTRGGRNSPTTTSSLSSIGVGDELKVKLRSTEPMQQVTCQGFSRGDIVWALSKRAAAPDNNNNANQTEIEFDIRVEPRMVPQMRILCFYVRAANKELIADSVDVDVVTNGPARNLVKLTTSREEAKPGQEVEVGVFTKPNSLVGILGLDQSVLLLKSGNDLSSKEVADDQKSYGSSSSSSSEASLNTASLLESADVVVMTNSLVYDGAGYRIGRLYANPLAFQTVMFKQHMVAESNKIALDSLILDHQIQPPEFHLKERKGAADQIRIRTLFPETWLWQNGTADSSGQLKFSSRVPDTITSWQLSAFSMHEAHGLALSSGITSVRVFRPFFIKLNLPYSIIRGEIVNIQAVIFNYSNRPMAARVTLDNKRNEFELVEATNSLVGEDDNKKPQREKRSNDNDSNRDSESRLVQVPAQDGVSVSFLIRPLKLGHIDIRVLAQGDHVGDGVVKKLLVKAEGQTQHFNKAMLVQLAGPQQSSWRQNVSIAVPANAVPGSQRVQVSAIGDILGAGLSNIDDLLRLPYGCGEQNMINLVPNIVILNYLKNTGRLRDFQRDRATRNIQVGYQRQLNYKRSDGSFSAFGESDANGSVWLTAYVLKTFQQASAITTVDKKVMEQAANFLTSHSRDDGSIEEVGMLHHKELASKSLGASGGGDSTTPNKASSIYLTAYTLIALMQRLNDDVGSKSKVEENNNTRQVLERGLDHLEQQLTSQLSTYELSIIAYTLELAAGRRQESAARAYEMLWARAIERPDDNQVHWSNRLEPAASAGAAEQGDTGSSSSSSSSETSSSASGGPEDRGSAPLRDSSGGGHSNSPRSAKQIAPPSPPPLKEFAVRSDQSAHLFVPDGLDVEMTSWALLSAVRRGELARALPIVRWLVAKQNSLGGFASTQDTVLAIEALANYAEASARAANNSAQSIEVEFVYPRAGSSSEGTSSAFSSQFRKHNLDQMLISRTNALVQQQTRLPDNITWVQIQASGVGSAVVQVSWQYNLLVSAEKPAFYLNPTLDRSSTANYLQLSICTYYKGTADQDGGSGNQAGGETGVVEGGGEAGRGDAGQLASASSSNMAVVEVELPSGYVADSEALPSLKRQAQIKRIETADGETRVLVYLDRVTRDELCFTVPAHRSSKVANNKPVPVTIYDYYKRNQAARIFYSAPVASSCDICEPDSCNESCSVSGGSASSPSSRSKQADNKLVSLHEQRRQRLQQATEATGGTHGSLIDSSNSTANSTSSVQTFDTFKLLPITSAFSALNQAAQNTTSLHF